MKYAHYQAAIEKARTEQLLQAEKKEQSYQQNLTVLQQELLSCRETLHQLDKEQSKKNKEHFQLIESHTLLQKNYEGQKVVLEKCTAELNDLQKMDAESRQKITQLLFELGQKNELWQQSEKDKNFLMEANQHLQDRLNKAEDKVETLRQEKLFLLQEKSELQGYINHLDKTAAAN